MYISTATWGLDYWEDMLFIPRKNSKSYDERRSVIYSKIRTTRTTTVKVIQELASAFFGAKNVIVTEHNENYYFNIEFENVFTRYVGDPINTDIIDDAIVDYAAAGDEEILINCNNVEKVIDVYKPAHLNYAFVFTIKNKVEIDSNMKKGYSTLPICNITKVGTWWKSFGEGNLNKSKVIKANSYTGYSQLSICGKYKSIIKSKREYLNSNSKVGYAKVGYATVGGD